MAKNLSSASRTFPFSESPTKRLQREGGFEVTVPPRFGAKSGPFVSVDMGVDEFMSIRRERKRVVFLLRSLSCSLL